MESCRRNGEVFAIGTADRVEHQRAIFRRARDGAKLIHRPAQRHSAGAGHKTEGWTEAGCAAARGGGADGAKRFRADGKTHAAGGNGARRPGGRAARSLRGIPRIARAAAVPHIAHGKRTQRELGDEDRACRIETLNDRRVFVDDLVLEAACAPRGGIAFYGEQIFCAPGNAVQRTAIFACGDFCVGGPGLGERAFLGEIGEEVQLRVIVLEAVEVHLGEGSAVILRARIRPLSSAMDAKARSSMRAGATRLGPPALLAEICVGGAGQRCSCRQRMEHIGRRDGVGQFERADVLVTIALIVETIEHHLLLRVGEWADIGHFRGLVQHLGRDFRQVLRLIFCIRRCLLRLRGERVEDAGK